MLLTVPHPRIRETKTSPGKFAVSASLLHFSTAQPILHRPEKTSNLTPAAIKPKQAEHASVQLAAHLGRKYRGGEGGEGMDHREKIKGLCVLVWLSVAVRRRRKA